MHTAPTATGNNILARIRRMVVHGIERDNDNPNPPRRAEILGFGLWALGHHDEEHEDTQVYSSCLGRFLSSCLCVLASLADLARFWWFSFHALGQFLRARFAIPFLKG